MPSPERAARGTITRPAATGGVIGKGEQRAAIEAAAVRLDKQTSFEFPVARRAPKDSSLDLAADANFRVERKLRVARSNN